MENLINAYKALVIEFKPFLAAFDADKAMPILTKMGEDEKEILDASPYAFEVKKLVNGGYVLKQKGFSRLASFSPIDNGTVAKFELKIVDFPKKATQFASKEEAEERLVGANHAVFCELTK